MYVVLVAVGTEGFSDISPGIEVSAKSECKVEQLIGDKPADQGTTRGTEVSCQREMVIGRLGVEEGSNPMNRAAMRIVQ